MPHRDRNDIARRPAQYWNIDGLPELMVGVLWMVWGGAWLVGQTVPHDWRWNAYWLIVPPALGLAVGAMTTGWDSMNWMFVALGAACALVGAVRLALFLRAHPISAVEGM